MIDKDIYNWKFLNPILKKAELIPISQKASKDAFFNASSKLKNGKIVAIFPEGEISKVSDMAKFYSGYKYIDIGDAVIVPFFIDGIFGSVFSRYKTKTKKSFFHKREITVSFGEPVLEHSVPDELRNIVKGLKN